MFKKNNFLIATAVIMFSLSACGSENVSSPTVLSTNAETSLSSDQETTAGSESSGQILESSLTNYLNSYSDGELYHLLYDVALNENVDTVSDSGKGITYMFSKDDNGKRIIGTVIAHYSDVNGADTSSEESFCKSFIDNTFPELSSYWDQAEIHSEGGDFGAIIAFDDYSITLIPDNKLDGMTLILSENK